MVLSEDGYRSFFDLSLDLFLIVDFEGKIVELNDSWENVLGYQKSDLRGHSLFEFVYKEDQSVTDTEMDRSAEGLDVTNFENRWVAKDGSLRCLRWRSRVDNRQKLVFAVALDITSEKKHVEQLVEARHDLEISLGKEIEARQLLQDHQERLTSLFMQAPALASVMRGPHHVFEFANDGYRKLFGNREIIGFSLEDVLPNLDPQISKILADVFSTGERFVGKSVSIAADWYGDGNIFPRIFDFIYEPIIALDRTVEGIWVWAIDVTEMQKLERDQKISERMASLGRLAAGVAHEINNPLAYSLGNLELCLTNSTLPDPLKRNIEKSIDGLERVAAIVRGLKTFSHVDETKPLSINLNSEIEAVVSISKHEVKLAQATLNVDVRAKSGVLAPRGAVGQILVNLVVNSAHAVATSTNKEISIVANDASSDFVEIKVSDTGTGIDKSLIGSVFDPFVTNKPIGKGTGLGLSIVHGLVTRLGGSISVTSEVGVGTTFLVRLPKAGAQQVSGLNPNLPIVQSTPRATIMIIDDESELRSVIETTLRKHETLGFEELATALKTYDLKRKTIDVILCDLSLRGETGRDFMTALAKRWPGDEKKIVFMTGGVTEESLANWLATVPNKVLRKPFRMRELTETIEAALPNRDLKLD